MNEQPIPLVVVIFGVIMCLIAIGALLKYVQKITENLAPREYLLKVIMTSFILLVGIFIVDKIVALRRDLLSPEESMTVFQTIKDILLIVVSFYFGTQVNNNNQKLN